MVGAISYVDAQGTGGKGLVISPKRVVFDNGQRIAEVLLANRGNNEERYRILLVNRAMNEQGQLTETKTPANGEFFADDYIRFSPRQVTLGPKETQKIRIMSRLSADSKEGEYRSHLMIQEIPAAKPAESASNVQNDTIGINVQAIFGVSIPMILRKGDLSAQASLSNPKIRTVDGKTFLDVTVNREGNKSILGTLNVFEKSQKIGILKNVAVYMSAPKRVVSIQLDPDHANLSGKALRITFGAEEKNEDAPQTELSFTAP